MNIQHSSASNEHYTPREIIEAAREVMGAIDLDPATTLAVNTAIVQARKIYTFDDNGLVQPWSGRVWLNPPGGRERNKSRAAIWWNKLANEYALGQVTEAIFLGFSLEALATTQDTRLWIGDFPFCIPRARIAFLQQKGDGAFEVGESPTHSNVIAYLPRPDRGSEARFVEVFSRFGRCST